MPPLLNREDLEQELVAAERYVFEGLKHIRHQKQKIARIESSQHNVAALESTPIAPVARRIWVQVKIRRRPRQARSREDWGR